MNHSLLLSISLLITLVPLKSGIAGEPFVANTPFELAGCVQIHDQTVAAKLVDRDQNGSFTDGVDRLFLDLDGDGQFHPLRERFAVADALRIRGTGTTEQYALTITSEPWQVTLDPIVFPKVTPLSE